MRVFTTSSKQGFEDFGYRWLEGRKLWPKGTEFLYYTEGFSVDCPGKDVSEIHELQAFKSRHQVYRAPDWRFDVVKFANIAFAGYDALYDHPGLGMRLDADCVTYEPIPEGLIESLIGDAAIATYQRVGMYSEIGIYICNGSHPKHKEFWDCYRDWYVTDKFKKFSMWHDCIGFDYAVKATNTPIANLSGEHGKSLHPQALSELGKYVDHMKGHRKAMAQSPENKWRALPV